MKLQLMIVTESGRLLMTCDVASRQGSARRATGSRHETEGKSRGALQRVVYSFSLGGAVTSTKSTPFLAEFVQPGSLEVLRRHDRPKLNVSLKGEQPRLNQRRK